MSYENEDRFDEAAKRLATEISPERDLWPGIAAAIDAPKRPKWVPMFAQAAAVVLLVGASSAITYIAVKGQPGLAPAIAPDLVFEQTSFGGRYNLGPGFQDARALLAAELDVELARLSPESGRHIEENLGLVRQAIHDISQALEQEPDNVLLQKKLLMAYREELSVLRRVSGLSRNVMVRNDI